MAEIEIEIDGQVLKASPTQTVIQVADAAGIYIPRFCYHKHLSIAANCRMCLVDVEKSPKALPACATPVLPGMKIFTKSQKTIDAQRAVMEFLLINHPLDCPICDQGGECELQDLSMGYGSSHSHYDECKRSVPDENLGPLIATEMTRCIYCTRCVRFGTEIAGMRELGGAFRGEHTEIGLFVEEAMKSEVSGNIIDLCPVGALTSKPYRFTARPWDLKQAPSIAAHDCIGSNIEVHTRFGKVMRVVAKENEAVNETWISDRDRFSYTGLYHADRLQKPLARIHGKLQEVEWEHALQIAANALHQAIAQHTSEQLGALASPNSTLEEFYLLQKIIRGLGSSHIDFQLRAQQSVNTLNTKKLSLTDLENCDAILLIGSNIQKEQPLAALRLRKAALKNAAILAINPVDYAFNFNVRAKKIIPPHYFLNVLAGVAKIIGVQEFADVQVDAETIALAQQLKDKQKICIILGALSLHHTEAASICYIAKLIADATGAIIHYMTDGANTQGCALVSELTEISKSSLAHPRKAYVLLNIEPALDCANSALATKAIQEAACVIALSSYRNNLLEDHADVILPVAGFTETSGTFVNATGVWQSFQGMAQSVGASRPAWKILRVLGNFLHLDGFAYESSEEIKHEVETALAKIEIKNTNFVKPKTFSLENKNILTRIGEIPIYATDALVRRAEPLQVAQTIMEGNLTAVRLHPKTAKKLNLVAQDMVRIKQKDVTQEVILSVQLDERIAEEAVWLAGGTEITAGLGDLFGEIELQKV